MRQLDLNREAYNKVKDDLESRYPNRVALMHDGKVVEIYGDTEAAFGIGCERYGEGKFSTKKIGQGPASLGSAASHARPVHIT